MRFVVPMALLVSACVTTREASGPLYTPYQPMAYDGGYANFPMGPGRYHIEVKGNAYSAKERITGYFYRRAMELCQADNFKGFRLAGEGVDRGTTEEGHSVVSNGYASGTSDRWGSSAWGRSVTKEVDGEKRYQASGDVECTDPAPSGLSATTPAPETH